MPNSPTTHCDAHRRAWAYGVAIGLVLSMIAGALAVSIFLDFRSLGPVGNYVDDVRDFLGRPLFSAAVALLLLVLACPGALSLFAAAGVAPRYEGSWSAPPRDLPFPGESLVESGWRLLFPTSHIRLSSDAIRGLRRTCVRLCWLVGLVGAIVIGAGVIRYVMLQVKPTSLERSCFMALVTALILISVFFSPALTTWLDVAAFLRRNAAWNCRGSRPQTPTDSNPHNPSGFVE